MRNDNTLGHRINNRNADRHGYHVPTEDGKGGYGMRDIEYLEEKRLKVLEEIKPICDAYGITDYDYEVRTAGQTETLRIRDTKIGCSSNSIFAIKQELTGYIFLAMWRERSLGYFDKQTKNVIKRYWLGG
jgi:hypothetical protein